MDIGRQLFRLAGRGGNDVGRQVVVVAIVVVLDLGARHRGRVEVAVHDQAVGQCAEQLAVALRLGVGQADARERDTGRPAGRLEVGLLAILPLEEGERVGVHRPPDHIGEQGVLHEGVDGAEVAAGEVAVANAQHIADLAVEVVDRAAVLRAGGCKLDELGRHTDREADRLVLQDRPADRAAVLHRLGHQLIGLAIAQLAGLLVALGGLP